MAAIPINLTIRANKNFNDEALLGFIRQRPNLEPDNFSDEQWMREQTRIWLNEQIANGKRQVFAEQNPAPPAPPHDPDIVS